MGVLGNGKLAKGIPLVFIVVDHAATTSNGTEILRVRVSYRI